MIGDVPRCVHVGHAAAAAGVDQDSVVECDPAITECLHCRLDADAGNHQIALEADSIGREDALDMVRAFERDRPVIGNQLDPVSSMDLGQHRGDLVAEHWR